MSDTSGDSESSIDEYDALRSFLSKHKSAHPAAQQTGRIDSDSESDTDSSSDEEDENGDFVEQTAMSHKLGHVDVFGMEGDICVVHNWLKHLADDSSHEQVTITKQTIRHYKRVMENMRHCLKDAGSMADKVTHFMSASVQKSIAAYFDMATQKVVASEGTGSVLMKELLATSNFRSEMLEEIEEGVLQHDGFPHAEMSVLNTKISKSVNSHIKIVLLDGTNKQAEAKTQEKLGQDRLKAYTGLEKELNDVGMMK